MNAQQLYTTPEGQRCRDEHPWHTQPQPGWGPRYLLQVIDSSRLLLQLFLLLGSAGLQIPELLPECGHGAGIQGAGGAELLHPAGQHGRPLCQAGRLSLLLLLGRGRAAGQQLSPKCRRGALHTHLTLKTQTASYGIIRNTSEQQQAAVSPLPALAAPVPTMSPEQWFPSRFCSLAPDLAFLLPQAVPHAGSPQPLLPGMAGSHLAASPHPSTPCPCCCRGLGRHPVQHCPMGAQTCGFLQVRLRVEA